MMSDVSWTDFWGSLLRFKIGIAVCLTSSNISASLSFINNSWCWWDFRLFELFVGILDLLIQNARVEGQLDSGIVDVKANTIELQGAPKVVILLCDFVGLTLWTVINIHICQTVHVDNMSGASTVLFTFTLDRGMTWEVFEFIIPTDKIHQLIKPHDLYVYIYFI